MELRTRISGKSYIYLTQNLPFAKKYFTDYSLADDGITSIRYKCNNFLSPDGSGKRCSTCYAEMIINPKRLIEKSNHVLIFEPSDFEAAFQQADALLSSCRPQLPRILEWTVKRIDYCIQIKTKYVEQYIELFQRGNKPYNNKAPLQKAISDLGTLH